MNVPVPLVITILRFIMSFPPLRKSKAGSTLRRTKTVDPDTERRLSELCLFPETPSFRKFKSPAQLSLVYSLQGGPTQARTSLVPDTKGRDAKPRLLLMGLRR